MLGGDVILRIDSKFYSLRHYQLVFLKVNEHRKQLFYAVLFILGISRFVAGAFFLSGDFRCYHVI
jgi:hypothetical protein